MKVIIPEDKPGGKLTKGTCCGIIRKSYYPEYGKGIEEKEYICAVVREPVDVVRTGQPSRSKIISEPQAENGVSEPKLFFVIGTG